MKARFAASALRHLDEILGFIAQENPRAASRVIADLRAAVELVKLAPLSGRTGSARGTREWVVRRRPDIIVYRIESDLLTIIGIYHGGRRRP